MGKQNAGEMKERGDAVVPIPQCGIIMPISATSNHGEKHWADVQKLLHRAIGIAGFDPVNVWQNETIDRVSERIIGNIFARDIVVADISDLNPNVMLELGLRLASKKPTVVIANEGGTIPFDIRDFNAIHYPGDLNILGMEVFFEQLSVALQSKHRGYLGNSYVPFLNSIIVEVLSPQTHPVGMEKLIMSRLDELSARFQRAEQIANTRQEFTQSMSALSTRSYIEVTIQDVTLDQLATLESAIDALPGCTSVRQGDNKLMVLARGGRGLDKTLAMLLDQTNKLKISPSRVSLSPTSIPFHTSD